MLDIIHFLLVTFHDSCAIKYRQPLKKLAYDSKHKIMIFMCETFQVTESGMLTELLDGLPVSEGKCTAVLQHFGNPSPSDRESLPRRLLSDTLVRTFKSSTYLHTPEISIMHGCFSLIVCSQHKEAAQGVYS